MKSIKCQKCELTNWSSMEACKRCGAPLMSENPPTDNRPTFSAPVQGESRQFPDYYAPPEKKEYPLVSLGVLMVVLGFILLGVSFVYSQRVAKWPLYFPILGFSFVASGVVFCLRMWAAVYIYLTGFIIATAFMFVTEDLQKPWVRLAVPTLIGLGLIDKMLKAKKSAALDYAGQQ